MPNEIPSRSYNDDAPPRYRLAARKLGGADKAAGVRKPDRDVLHVFIEDILKSAAFHEALIVVCELNSADNNAGERATAYTRNYAKAVLDGYKEGYES